MKNKACEDLTASFLIQCESEGDEIKDIFVHLQFLEHHFCFIKKKLLYALTVLEIYIKNFEIPMSFADLL